MRNKLDNQSTVSFKHYSIGDISRILSMPAPTIRFYDQEGIVTPKRNRENQYREYTVVDGNYLLKTKELKNIGVSISDTEALLNTSSLSKYHEGLNIINDRLDEEIFRLTLLKEGLEKGLEKCHKAEHLLNVITIETRPETWRYDYQKNDQFMDDDASIEALRGWSDYMPASAISFRFRKEDLEDKNKKPDLYWGLSIPAGLVAGTHLDELSKSEYMPSCKAICTVFRSINEVFLKPQFLKAALDFMEKHSFKLTGDIVGYSLARVIDEKGNLCHYYEAWLPIDIDNVL